MTVHIAAIGNSHIGAIKSAWDQIEHEVPDLKFTFFASRSRYMEYLRAKQGKLVPTQPSTESSMKFTSGGKTVIDPAEYDAFLLYGLRSRPYMPDRKQHYSEEVHKAAYFDLKRKQALPKIVKLFRRVTDKPIFVSLHPLPISDKTANQGRMFKDEGEYDYDFGATLAARFFKEEFNATLIKQPAETIENNQYTADIYVKDAEKLQIGKEGDSTIYGEEDMIHMNSDYGKLWFKNLIPEALALEGPRPATERSSSGAQRPAGVCADQAPVAAGKLQQILRPRRRTAKLKLNLSRS